MLDSMPGRRGNTTVLKVSVLPKSLSASRLDWPSTSTFTVFPRCARFLESEIDFCISMMAVSLRAFTSSGTSSASRLWEAVPGLGEYLNMKALSNRTVRIISRVASNSFSVSPQKPTMMSVVRAMPGTRSRSRRTTSRNTSGV